MDRRNTASFSGGVKRSANGFHLNQNKTWSGHGSKNVVTRIEVSPMKEMRSCETCFRSYHFYCSGQSPWDPDESTAAGMSYNLGSELFYV